MSYKYLLLTAAILTVLFLIAVLNIEKIGNNVAKENELKIVLMGQISELDRISPDNISSIPLWHINYNVWGTLLTRRSKRPAIAKSYSVSEDQLEYTFVIDENAKFSNGRSILAEDVKFSIDRLISLQVTGHANVLELIEKLKITNEREIVITLKKPTVSFLNTLTIPEFAIVPKEIFDDEKKITSYNIVSGAYSIKNIDFQNQKIIFSKNPYFRGHTTDSWNTIEVTLIDDGSEMLNAIKSNKAHFYEIFDSMADKIAEYSKSDANLDNYFTKPSFSTFLVPNFKMLTSNQSKKISSYFRDNFRFGSKGGYEVQTDQLLPPKTYGSLSDDEVNALNISYSVDTKLPNPLLIKIPKQSPLTEALRKTFDKMGVKVKFVWYSSDEDCHLYGRGQGMNAEYPELEFHLNMIGPYKFIDTTKENKELVISALHELDDKKRSNYLKQISKNLLESGAVIPATVRSYLHIYNKNIVNAELIPNYDGDIPFHRFRKR